MTTALSAHQIGATAHARILDSDSSWSVLASVSCAIYIEANAGDVLWIAANPSALHPRTVLLPVMPAELPTVGTECCLEDDCLHVGPNLVLEFWDAEIWCPELVVGDGVSTSEAARRITIAIDQAAVRTSPQGLLARILFPHVLHAGRSSCSAAEHAFVAAASRAMESLCQASTGFGLLEQLQDAIELVGWGCGLTPAGDDLLGAFLYTLRVLDPPHGGLIGIDWEPVDGWLQQVRPLTNRISFVILADHAHGDAAALLHEFLNAALDGHSLEHLVGAAGRVSAIGQSSGWDMLIGVRCACSIAARILDHRPAATLGPSGRVERRGMRQEPTTCGAAIP